MPTRRWLSLVGALGLILPAPFGFTRTVAQQPPATPQPTFRTEANYVRVDVFPTRDGAPVLDLTQEDFEVLEAGVPQKLEQFEHVVIRAAGPQDTRIEPNTIAESRSMATNPRARVFVVFLDTNQVGIEGSHNIRKPLIDALDRVIGADDLVGVMTPEMSAADVTFARKTTTIEGFLTRYWTWGQRNQMNSLDPVEDQYRVCYPGLGPSQVCADDDRGVADEMIERRREHLTIAALQDLVRFVRGVREERKAVLVISDGWRLFRPNQRLARQLGCRVPRTTVGVDPRTGRITANPVEPGLQASPLICEKDRQTLANTDDAQDFRTLMDDANGSNVSFYPIDPRGLVVFDEPIAKPTTGLPPPGSTTITPPSVDQSRLNERLESLRTLAEATDGLAVVNSNDLSAGMKRVVADLSSYYLLGYYSNGKLDGRFHSITVRVKRPGVLVRARRGYLAATPAAMSAAARTAAAPKAIDVETLAIQAALAPLAGMQRELPLRIHAAAGWNGVTPGFWVVAEFADTAPQDRDVDVTIVSPSGATIGRATGRGGGRSVLIPVVVSSSEPAGAGEYVIRVRSDGGTGSVRINLPATPEAGGAVFMRRGPTTGNKDVPTADLRFHRNERLHLEIPMPDSAAPAARLLDRMGKPLAIPLTATVRDAADGSRWQTTELALAPLAPGDYVIEMTRAAGSGSEKRTLVAFRIVP